MLHDPWHSFFVICYILVISRMEILLVLHGLIILCTLMKGSSTGGAVMSWKDELRNEINSIQVRYQTLEKEFSTNNQLLEKSKERIQFLEREYNCLREERDSLVQKLCLSAQNTTSVNNQKTKISKELIMEIQRRKDLEEEVKQFSLAFSCRQRSFTSFSDEVNAKIESRKCANPI